MPLINLLNQLLLMHEKRYSTFRVILSKMRFIVLYFSIFYGQAHSTRF